MDNANLLGIAGFFISSILGLWTIYIQARKLQGENRKINAEATLSEVEAAEKIAEIYKRLDDLNTISDAQKKRISDLEISLQIERESRLKERLSFEKLLDQEREARTIVEQNFERLKKWVEHLVEKGVIPEPFEDEILPVVAVKDDKE